MFSRVFVAAVAVLPFAAQVASAADCARSYTVKLGDYCDKISVANNASTYQLAAINFPTVNAECTNLQIGQEICLGTKGEDCQETYEVQPNDTCEKIMSTFNVNGTILTHNNPQINADCTNIYVGEVICVANQGVVPAAPAGVIVPPPVAITQSTVAAQPTREPVITPSAAAPVVTATPTAAPAEDDDDLPFCDELEDDE